MRDFIFLILLFRLSFPLFFRALCALRHQKMKKMENESKKMMASAGAGCRLDLYNTTADPPTGTNLCIVSTQPTRTQQAAIATKN